MSPPFLRLCFVGLLLALWLAFAGPTQAAGVSVSPLRVNFGAERGVAAITLTNTSRETLQVEAEVLPWPADAAGQSPRDITVNPPISTLAPGAKVTVRLGVVKHLPTDVERAYRFYVTELPAPRSQEAQGLGVRLRMGIPVFVVADKPQALPLEWSAQTDEQGVLVTALNRGNVHQRVSQVVMRQDSSQFAAAQGLPYVLAGGTATFRLPAAAAAAARTKLALQVRIDEVMTPVDVALP